MSLRSFIVKEVLYSGHLQSLGAASIVLVAAFLLNLPVAGSLLIAVYLLFQAIYYFDRYRDIDADTITNRERVTHLMSYRSYIPVIALIGLVLAGGLLIRSGTIVATVFAALIAVFGFLYPLFFKRQTMHLPLFKNIYVALVFSLLVFFPFLYAGRPIVVSYSVITLFLFVLGESLITQLLLDQKDRTSDGEHGLRTLPTLLGERQAQLYILTASLVLVGSAVLAADTFSFRGLIPIAVATFVFNLLVVALLHRGDRRGFVLAAAKYLLWPIILVFT